ncbi:MAG: hypothetical protein LBH42_06130, partial [Treponema sp.]|nr:hypothetical protein [Treponema sp.]
MKRSLFAILILTLAFTACETSSGENNTNINPGDTVNYPMLVVVNDYDLGDMTDGESGWYSLLLGIQDVGKYVDLDLSGCTLS